MLRTNRLQKEHYESVCAAGEKRALPRRVNLAMNLWARLRRRLSDFRRDCQIDEQVYQLHRQWVRENPHERILDLGCFSGNSLSLWLAEQCNDYLGVDLSEGAVAKLQEDLDQSGHSHAHVRAMDFLENSFPQDHFSVVYAQSVLHHFKDLDVLCRELRRILRPGGILISFDPMQNWWPARVLRAAYRPFQSSAAWEWPFTDQAIRTLRKYFSIEVARPILGASKWSLLLAFFPGFYGFAVKAGRRKDVVDGRALHGDVKSIPSCLQITMMLRKPLN